MNPKIRILISVLLGVALAALIAFIQIPKAPVQTDGVIGTSFGGSFTGLTDEQGQKITADTFKDKYEIVFFGFTSCPSICPTELQKVARVLKELPVADAAKIAPIFVSVDPARDTPKVLKDYTDLFHPAIIGLTGSKEEIDAIKADWKVYAAKVQTEEMTDYTVDHSAFVYLRDPEGRIQGLFKTSDSPSVVLETIKKVLR